jgi:hypothetical protein
MTRFRVCTLSVLFLAVPALAQQQPGLPQPRLDSITPIGAKAGTTIAELTIAGADLEDTESLLFSHPGIMAEIIVPPPPKPDPKDPKKKDPCRRASSRSRWPAMFRRATTTSVSSTSWA